MALQERFKMQLRRDVRVMGLTLVRVLPVGPVQWLSCLLGYSDTVCHHLLLAMNHSLDLRGSRCVVYSSPSWAAELSKLIIKLACIW